MLWILMVIKSIRTFFLLLAGLAIVSHMIIPHDHHLSGPVFGQKDTCPVSDERPGGHHGFPVHCHAFNDLAAEKFSPVIIKKNFQSSFASVIWLPGYIMPEIHLSQTVPSDSGKPFSDIYIPDFSPFRAPPSHI